MNLIKNKKFLLFTFGSIALYVIYLLVVFNFTKTPTLPVHDTVFGDIVLEKTREEEVVKNLGKPEYVDTKLSNKGLYYKSSENYIYNVAYSKNSTLVATKEIVVSPYSIKDFGAPDFQLFNDYSSNLFWNVYLSKGVALQNGDGMVFAIVRFKPQSKNTFMSKIAPLFDMTVSSKTIPEPE